MEFKHAYGGRRPRMKIENKTNKTNPDPAEIEFEDDGAAYIHGRR